MRHQPRQPLLPPGSSCERAGATRATEVMTTPTPLMNDDAKNPWLMCTPAFRSPSWHPALPTAPSLHSLFHGRLPPACGGRIASGRRRLRVSLRRHGLHGVTCPQRHCQMRDLSSSASRRHASRPREWGRSGAKENGGREREVEGTLAGTPSSPVEAPSRGCPLH
jgi:hypothetical protein